MSYLSAPTEDHLFGTFSFLRVKATFEAINGKSEGAAKFVAVLENATKQRDLKFITLLCWTDVLTSRNLLRKYRSWCPDCFYDQRLSTQTIYEPLLWFIDDVKICSIHQEFLVSTCPYCNNQASVLKTNSRPGYCPICEKWLGSCSNHDSSNNTPTDDELHFQLWVVENVGEMLSSAPRLQSQLLQSNLAKSISSIIDCSYGGVAQRLATAMGKSKSSVWGWKHGRNMPSLGEILIACYIGGITLLDFLTSEGSVKPGLPTRQVLINNKNRKKKAPSRMILNIDSVRLELLGYLDPATEPMPMRHVAKCVVYEEKLLRKKFPEICKQISGRYLSNMKELSKKRRSDFVDEITSGVFNLHSQGQPITRARIANYLNKPEYKSNPKVCGPMMQAKQKLSRL